MRDPALASVYVDYFNETHGMVRDTMRRFVNEAVKPHIDAWEEAGAFPREIYPQAGQPGLPLSIGHPTEFGGSGGRTCS
jgi:acyl-CoA dehydrogenase